MACRRHGGGLVGRRPRGFTVTPKGADEQRHQPVPRLLTTLMIGHVVALAVFGSVILGRTPWSYPVPAVAIGTAALAGMNLILLLVASARIRSERFAGDRRRGERFRVSVFARLGPDAVELVDVSLTGAMFISTNDTTVDGRGLRLSRPNGDEVVLRVDERSRRPIAPDGSHLVAVEFASGQELALAELSRMLFTVGSDHPAAPEPSVTGSRTSESAAERPAGAVSAGSRT